VACRSLNVTNKCSHWRAYERANQRHMLESVIENNQTELLEDRVIKREQVHELSDLTSVRSSSASRDLKDPAGDHLLQNNSGLANQFAAAGGIMYRRAPAEGSIRIIPTERLGRRLSAYY
jgi:hypothetical protein